MGLFDHFPYTNIHEMNLSWILEKIQDLEKLVMNFVSLNTIKYANPIQWDITSQYEVNTIVVDPGDGTAYISVQPVPIGVALTNTDYWSVVFSLSGMLDVNKNITLRDDGGNVLSTFASAIGDWLIWNNTLYKVIQTINVNEAYVPGTNITRFTVELFIKEYISDLSTTLNNIIGALSDLTTADTSSIVNAINELVTRLSNLDTTIGALSDLTTTDKSSIVNAINELVTGIVTGLDNLDTTIGDLSDLTTTDKSSIVNAINEVKAASFDTSKLGNIIYEDQVYTATETFSDYNYSLNNSTITSDHNVVIDNGKMDNVPITSTYNPAVDLVNTAEISNCDVTGSKIAVNMNTTVNDAKVHGNNIKGNDYGVLINADSNGDSFIVTENSIESDSGDAVEVNTPKNENTNDSKNIIIGHNTLAALSVGSLVNAGFSVGIARGRNVIVNGNSSRASRKEAVHVEDNTARAIITSNVFDECTEQATALSVNYSDNNFTKNGLTNGGRPLIVSNNYFKAAAGNTSYGLAIVNTTTDDDSMIIATDNIIEGFRIGIASSSDSQHYHARNFDGCIVTGCQIGIGTNCRNVGRITFDNISGKVISANKNSHIDEVIVTTYKDPDDLVQIGNDPTSFTCNRFKLNLRQTMVDGNDYKLFKMPNVMEGYLTLHFKVGGNFTKRVFTISNGTLTQVGGKAYGSVLFTPAISDGYIKVSTYNLASSSMVEVDFDFTGVAEYHN